MARNQRGLVETSLPDSPTMKRHRDEKSLTPLQLSGHQLREQPGEPDPAPMLQFERKMPCDIAIGDRGHHAVMNGRCSQAGCARHKSARERDAAAVASFAGQEVE